MSNFISFLALMFIFNCQNSSKDKLNQSSNNLEYIDDSKDDTKNILNQSSNEYINNYKKLGQIGGDKIIIENTEFITSEKVVKSEKVKVEGSHIIDKNGNRYTIIHSYKSDKMESVTNADFK